MIQVREKRRDLYIPCTMTLNNHDWDRVWFYLRNDGAKLPAYTGKVLTERLDSWVHGVSPTDQQAKLDVFTNALRRLVKKGLTTAAVVANFHRQSVLPLMERTLPIFQLTAQASSEGSRMMEELLVEVATQRAKRTVGAFPSDPAELWAIKMHPEEGYIKLVRIVSIF